MVSLFRVSSVGRYYLWCPLFRVSFVRRYYLWCPLFRVSFNRHCTDQPICQPFIHTINYMSTCILVEGRIKGKICVYISHVAQVSDTAQVTRQISLLGLIA